MLKIKYYKCDKSYTMKNLSTIYLVPAADTSPHVTLHWDQADHVLHLPATAADTRVVTQCCDTSHLCVL